MSVDLSAIPPVAKRKNCPSFKRWLLTLLVFVLCGGVITLKLWPEEQVTRGAFFWHCLISIPVLLWSAVFSLRWLGWLVSEWQADGWDSEREADIAAEIHRGQRFLTLEAVSIRLPHVVGSEALAEQFLLPQAVVLPVVVNETTHSVTYQARFNSVGQSVFERAYTLLTSLLEGAKLKKALAQGIKGLKITTFIQIDTDSELSSEELTSLKNDIGKLYPFLSSFNISPHFTLMDIDKIMDEKNDVDRILLLSIRFFRNPLDGHSEVGVALLLGSLKDNLSPVNLPRLHRPERSRDPGDLNQSIEQSLLWGDTRREDVSHLWLAGLGIENKAQSFLASNNIKLSQVDAEGTFIDIDMKSGCTSKVSPWLAIALAAENSGKEPAPQLVMSIPDSDSLPWWLIIHPA